MRPLLCHPDQPAVVAGFRAACPACESFWDLESLASPSAYTDSYPRERLHFDPRIGELKVSTLRRWLSETGVDLRGRVVCEVGFGGGHCLAFLRGTAGDVFGLEAIPANIEHAVSLGLSPEALFRSDQLPRALPRPVSLWLFQDSFEHILELEEFLPWLEANSTENAQLLLVAPDAASRSRRLLGRYWPHRVADHLFHWSPRGLAALLGAYGFGVVRRFHPTKRISSEMAVRHLRQTRLSGVAAWLAPAVPPLDMWFNLGEMGLLFERRPR